MSEQPFVKQIRKLLEETKGLDDKSPARKAAPAPRAAVTEEADPDMALLDEIEAGLEDELEEEGLEGPGEASAPVAAPRVDAEDAGPRGFRRRRRAGGEAGAGGERPLARFLQFLGNLQDRRADALAKGRRPGRMISPSLMKEASGQAVDPGDPVAERRRKQIQEFRAAWVESLNMKPSVQVAALKPIGAGESTPATPAAATPASPTPAAAASQTTSTATPAPAASPVAKGAASPASAAAASATVAAPKPAPAPAASAAPAPHAPAKSKKDGDRKS